MASAVLKKSVTDLTRRKARTVFTVLTLAIAIASVGIFAIPSLMDTAMQKEVHANKLPDLTLSLKPLALTKAQLAALRRLPNVVVPVADGAAFQRALYERHRIEVPVFDVAGATVMRVSAQAYNDESDLDALTEALRAA